MESRNPKIEKVGTSAFDGGKEMSRDDAPEAAGSFGQNEYRVRLTDALRMLPGAEGQRFATVFEHGSLQLEIYAPRGRDTQSPHTRDEAYIVMQGSGEFVVGKERHACAPGDFLFAPAGVPHRFENFTDDLTLWVIFYGPEGGEAQAGATGPIR